MKKCEMLDLPNKTARCLCRMARIHFTSLKYLGTISHSLSMCTAGITIIITIPLLLLGQSPSSVIILPGPPAVCMLIT